MLLFIDGVIHLSISEDGAGVTYLFKFLLGSYLITFPYQEKLAYKLSQQFAFPSATYGIVRF